MDARAAAGRVLSSSATLVSSSLAATSEEDLHGTSDQWVTSEDAIEYRCRNQAKTADQAPSDYSAAILRKSNDDIETGRSESDATERLQRLKIGRGSRYMCEPTAQPARLCSALTEGAPAYEVNGCSPDTPLSRSLVRFPR